MIKLNLLPAGYQQKGTVKAAAIIAIGIWILSLVILLLFTFSLNSQVVSAIAAGQKLKPNKDKIAVLNKAKQQYDQTYSTMKPETDFLQSVVKQPLGFAKVMADIAHGTTDWVVVEKYTITPGSPNITLTAWVKDYAAYNRWRMTLLRDQDFVGTLSMSGPVINGQGGVQPGAGGGTPGSQGMAPAAPTPSPDTTNGQGGATAGGFNYPKYKFPQAFTVTVNLVLQTADVVTQPAFSAGGGGAAGASGGAPGSGPPGSPSTPGAAGSPPPASN